VLLRVKAVAGIAMAVAAFGLWRERRSWWPRSLRTPSRRARAGLVAAGAAGAGWWILIAVLTQAGFSGNDRYLVLGAALIAIVGGVGWAWGSIALATLLRRLGGALASGGARARQRITAPAVSGGIGALAVAAVFMALPPWIGANVVDIPATHRALVYQAHLREDMTRVVRYLGGPDKVLRCGTVMTEGFQVPMLAWTLGVHTLQVQGSPLPRAVPPPAPNVIFQTRAQRHASLLPAVRTWKQTQYRLVAHMRTFKVYSQCAGKVSL
jgi:hypothetical protein